MKAITAEDLYNCIDKLKDNNVPGPMNCFFVSEDIKMGLEQGVLEDRKDFVSFGGYDVIDVGTKRKAVTADYV